MKEQEVKLTLQETEQLCELFMDCKLSVLQENELRYVLTRVGHHSQLIDDVRALMGIELSAFNKPVAKGHAHRFTLWSKRSVYIGIAASIILLLGIGLPIFHKTINKTPASQSFYIAYADGHKLSDEDAKAQIKADMRSADEFMKEMSEVEAREKQMNLEFFNN